MSKIELQPGEYVITRDAALRLLEASFITGPDAETCLNAYDRDGGTGSDSARAASIFNFRKGGAK